MTDFDLDGYLEEMGRGVEEALERALHGLEDLVGAPAASAIRHGVMGGGKRLRPILCITAYRACGGGAGDAAFDLAASLELIHAYSLMHDDLPSMDDAELRRGMASTHREHGERMTTKAGVLLIPLAALQALRAARRLECGEDGAASVAQRLMQAAGAGGMVGGQWLDLVSEGEALTPEALDGLHGRKTGALLTASLEIGAVAAAAEESAVEAFKSFGRAIGLAFQIADDLLDATQSTSALGKNPSDLDLRKSTYVSLYGVDEARRRAENRVGDALGALECSGISAPALTSLAHYTVARKK